MFETFSRRIVDAINKDKYEAVPILAYLQEFNRAVKAAAGSQPIGY